MADEAGQVQKSKNDEKTELPKQKGKIKVYVGALGGDAEEVTVDDGTTLKDIIKDRNFTGLEVRLNSNDAADNTQLKDQDVVVAVPDAIVGGG